VKEHADRVQFPALRYKKLKNQKLKIKITEFCSFNAERNNLHKFYILIFTF